MTGERWRSLRASVRVRMTAAAAVVIGVTLLVAAVALVASLHAVLVREAHATASLRASEAARVLDSGGDPAAGLAGDDDTVLQVIERSGAVLASTPNAAGHGALAGIAAGQSREIDVPFDDDPFLVVAAPAGGGRIILVGRSLDGVSESTRALAALLAVGLPLLLSRSARRPGGWWAVPWRRWTPSAPRWTRYPPPTRGGGWRRLPRVTRSAGWRPP